MPPKRKSTEAPSAAKKQQKGDSLLVPELKDIPRNPRWSAVSGSANADMQYKFQTRDPESAYSWVCFCPNRITPNDKCKKDCPCVKKPEKFPDHPWLVMNAAFSKSISYQIMQCLRDPEGIGMRGISDQLGFATLEILQNLMLDFHEAKGNWKEQWVICESLFLYAARAPMEELLLYDDGDKVSETAEMLRTMFLTMLATLEREGLLGPDSEVKNLAVIMALYFALGEPGQGGNEPLAYDDTDLGVKVLAYANKYKIVLHSPTEIKDLIDQLQPEAEEVTLPPPDENNNDPWKWSAELNKYKRRHGLGGGDIGGDRFDFTAWTSAERKQASYDNKDPMTRTMINHIKRGLVMQPA